MGHNCRWAPAGPPIRNDLALQIQERGNGTNVLGSRANPTGLELTSVAIVF